MKTRDGVTLYADVYRPAGDGTFPVLLSRTPYGKSGENDFAEKAAADGFMVVIQDARGRFNSEGKWYPFKYEMNDGYDAVEWAAKLPHADGKVGFYGGSYVGAATNLGVLSNPPHLVTFATTMTGSNYFDGWIYLGGAFQQLFDEYWTRGLAADTISRSMVRHAGSFSDDTNGPLTQFPLYHEKFPSKAEQMATYAPYFLDWLAHPTYDAYWKRWTIEGNYEKIKVPALTIAGWYDIFQRGSFRNYMGMRDHAGTQVARNEQRLVVMIGGHAGSGRKIGDVDFGPNALNFGGGEIPDEHGIMLDWFEYFFFGKQNEFSDPTHPVRIFVMGKNVWQNEREWPLARARETKYYLQSAGAANSALGNGTFATASEANTPPDTFVYDPANPVPTLGGPLCCPPKRGPQDQSAIEKRHDVLVYSTPPLINDVEVIGPVSLDLFATSSAVDTDFTAKLVDVWPNGFAQNLTEGIIRARFRKSPLGTPTLITPGKVYEYTIDMWSTSNVFLKGHRIRLEVSSSNFPRFDRNFNTGTSPTVSHGFIKATNTILHNSSYPSALILPIIPD